MNKETAGEKVFNILNLIFMVFVMIIFILPLINVVSTSLVSYKEAMDKQFVFIPSKLDFTAYLLIFSNGSVILDAYKITIFRVVVGTFSNMLFTYFLAYGLAKKDLPGRNPITMFIFITMLFSSGLIPYYILIKYLHLMDSIWVYILPGLVSAWNVLLLRNFIMDIPESMTESAEIDGANEGTIIFRIILPLSIPAMATISLFYAVGHWNSWFDAFLFVGKPKKQPIQLVLRNILALSQVGVSQVNANMAQVKRALPPPHSIKNAVIVVSTLPVVLIYPFVQKYFVKGVMIGSVKG